MGVGSKKAMNWKGIKCVGCNRDIGCPNCGQILPDLRVVTVDGVGPFCTSECRDEWYKRGEKMKMIEIRANCFKKRKRL